MKGYLLPGGRCKCSYRYTDAIITANDLDMGHSQARRVWSYYFQYGYDGSS
jgi:hypothetical protein